MAEGKVFIGGVSYQTTESSLREHFSRYGEITDCFVMRDKATGKPRGFAFCCFKDPEVAQLAVTETHVIDGRQVEVKVAIPKDQTAERASPGRTQQGTQGKYRKIFVGGLSPGTTDEIFRAYFGQFGHMEDSVVMFDPATNRPRGFGFVTYGDDASVERVFQVGNVHELDGKKVVVKRAVPKDASAPPARAGGMHGAALRIWPQFAGGLHGPGRGNGISVGLMPGLAIQHVGRGRGGGYGARDAPALNPRTAAAPLPRDLDLGAPKPRLRYLAGFRGDLAAAQVGFGGGGGGGGGWGQPGPLWAGSPEIAFVQGGIFPPGAVEQLVAMQQAAAMGQGDFSSLQYVVPQFARQGGMGGQQGGFDGAPAGFSDEMGGKFGWGNGHGQHGGGGGRQGGHGHGNGNGNGNGNGRGGQE